MEAIGLTASLIAILELCGKTILYIQTAKGGSKHKAQLMTEIQSLQLVVGELHDVSDDDGWKKTMEILAEPGAPLKLLEETLRSLAQKLAPNTSLRRGLDVVRWPFQEKEVNSVLAMIERQKASLSLALENNSRMLQDRIASQVDSNRDSLEELKTICGGLQEEINTVKRNLDQSRARETLQWMTKLNFGPRHDTILQSWDRKTGTGTWALRHPLFIEWTATKTTATKLWCHGIPGAGKSVAAAIIFDHLRENLRLSNQNISVATLYCDHEQQAEQNLDELERSVLHQALADCETIPETLRTLRQETKDGFSPSLPKLHSVIASSSAASQTLFVVLDALDEASETIQDQLVDRISALPFREVRILCTSRTWPKFEEAFAGLPQIQISASDNDVEQFIRNKIEDVSRLRKVMGESTTLKDQVVTKVLEKAKGSFLMAKHHMDEISSAITRKQLLQKLEKLPEKMQDAYDLTMKRIGLQAEPDKTLAYRTLSLVFGARRQLTIPEIQHALATLTLYKDDGEDESDDVKQDDMPSADIIVQCCQGLLILENTSWRPFLRASHYTANEYFCQKYQDWFPDGQELLAMACCYYLSHSNLKDQIENPSRHYYLLLVDCHPFFPYAGEYWGVHFLEARIQSLTPLRTHVEGVMQSWWTNSTGVARLVRQRDRVILNILAPFRIIPKIHQQGSDVNAVDNNGQCLLSNTLDDADVLAVEFLLKLPSLNINPTGSDLDRMLESAIKLQIIPLAQRVLKTIASDRRLVQSRDGTLSERLKNVQNDLVAHFCGARHGKGASFFEAVMGTVQDLDPQDDRALLLDLMWTLNFWSESGLDLLGFFLDNNLRLGATDADGNGMLHIAAKVGSVGVTRFLLQQNLNPDSVNTQGKSPAQVAIDNNNFGVFLQLLSAMSVSARRLLWDPRHATTGDSHVKWRRDDRFEIILFEVQKGPCGSEAGAWKRTGLAWEVIGDVCHAHDMRNFIDVLLGLGTDINSQDNNGMTAFSHITAKPSKWNISCFDKPPVAGADPNARKSKGMIPILYAAASRPNSTGVRLRIVTTFLREGADASDKDGSGVSAVQQVLYPGGYVDDDALEAARTLAKQSASNESTSQYHYIGNCRKDSIWADFKHILEILSVILGNKALGWELRDAPKATGRNGYKATIRLDELTRSEKDALKERFRSDEPLKWLGRTEIDRRIEEEIFELCAMAGLL